MPDNPEPLDPQLKEKTIDFFLENEPPGNQVIVGNYLKLVTSRAKPEHEVNVPSIHLYCDVCKGDRIFEMSRMITISIRNHPQFWPYACRNCARQTKVFAIIATAIAESSGKPTASSLARAVLKIGETPAFGPPTPEPVSRLLGADREYYFKGRRSENQGLGIAAFAYYRRVVENRKTTIINEIIRVAQAISADTAMIADLEAAKHETQFSKAVETVKHGIPGTLLINGHNPLTLLHSALSEGLHAKPDDKCLELATSIRLVLTELIDRMATALKDDVELSAALNKLMQLKNKSLS